MTTRKTKRTTKPKPAQSATPATPAMIHAALKVLASRGGQARWAGTTKKERSEAIKKVVRARRWRPVKPKPDD